MSVSEGYCSWLTIALLSLGFAISLAQTTSASPQGDPIQAKTQVDIDTTKFNNLIKDGHASEALSFAQQLCKKSQKEPQYRVLQARALAAMHRFKEALQAVNQGLALAPHSLSLWEQKAKLSDDMRDLKSARQASNEAVRLNSKDPTVWSTKACLGCF